MWTTSDQHYSIYSNEQMLPPGLWCAKVWSLSTRGSGMNDFDHLTLMILNVSAKSQYQPRQTALSRFCRLSKLGPTLTSRIGPTERMRLFLLNLFHLKLVCQLIKRAWEIVSWRLDPKTISKCHSTWAILWNPVTLGIHEEKGNKFILELQYVSQQISQDTTDQ